MGTGFLNSRAAPNSEREKDRAHSILWTIVTDSIYVVGTGGVLQPANRTPYRLEDDLQKLIADHPELLPGDQIDSSNPRRWRLIKREAGVGPSQGSGRWSLDHLFMDQDGIPTLVEAKRGGNPEARRDVVAQLIEYAANGSLYWPIDQLRGWFEELCKGHELAVASVAELLEGGESETVEEDYERFWELVGTNLRERHIRLIFVADEIPGELKTLVEFLNEEMSRVEVLAVEVVQYAGNGQQMLMPRLVGQTSKAIAAKTTKRAASRESPWTAPEILERLGEASGLAMRMGEEILKWADERGDLQVHGNRGLTYPILHLRLSLPRGLVTMCSLYSVPKYLLEIPFGSVCNQPPYVNPVERAELHTALKPMTQMAKGDPALEQFAYAGTGTLRSTEELHMVLGLIGGYIDRIKAAASL
jgi:hypothetical protein